MAGSINEEYDEVDRLEDEADAVDGDDEDAVGVDDGEAIEHPEHAIEDCREVGDRREILHRLSLDYSYECRPVGVAASQPHLFKFRPNEQFDNNKKRRGRHYIELTQGRGTSRRR